MFQVDSNSYIISWMKPMQATHWFGSWTAADDVKQYLLFAIWAVVRCYKAPLFVMGCTVTLVS